MVLISLNDKIIRYLFQVKCEMFLFYFELFSSSISAASRKNQLSDEFFKIGFMPYFLSLNSPLSRYRDRNSRSALAFSNQHMEKR